MNSRYLRLFALCVAASIGTVSAPAADGMSVQAERGSTAQPSLADLISELSRTNPEIRAARHRYDAALKRPSQVSTLPDPKATYVDFGVGRPFSSLSVSDFAYRAVGVSQEIPFPGKLSLAGEQARKEAESEGQMYRATVVDVTARMKIAFFDWFAISKAIEVTNRNRDLLDRFEKIARARYSVGKGIQQDVLKAQVEISRLVQQLEVWEQRRASAEAQINALLNRASGTPVGKPPELKRSRFQMDLDAVLTAVAENSPQLRATQFLVDSRSVGVERARLDYRPDFNFSFQWQRTASPFPDYYMAMAEVRLPIYFWRKQRFAVEEAAARLEQSRQEYQAKRQELTFLAKDQYLIAKTSERLLALFESGVIPQSSLSLESALAGYEVGSVDFLTLINNLVTLLTFEMQYYEELARHEQALARLEPIVGMQLTQP